MVQHVLMTQARESSRTADDATEGAVFAAVDSGLDPLRALQLGVRRVRETFDSATNVADAGSRLVRGQFGRVLTSGVIAGAAIGGGLAAISNGVALLRGAKSVKSATLDTLKHTLSSSATGAAVGSIALVTESALMRAGAARVAMGAAPVAIALTAVDVGKDVSRLATGKIDRQVFANNSAQHLAKGGFAWLGMEGGAAVGSAIVPGVGTALGALLGGVAGSLFGGWLTRRKANR
jgi:hypothetical protein